MAIRVVAALAAQAALVPSLADPMVLLLLAEPEVSAAAEQQEPHLAPGLTEIL